MMIIMMIIIMNIESEREGGYSIMPVKVVMSHVLTPM